jgi:hypothetical protein
MTCSSCGGVVGRDCFNPQECAEISAMQAMQAQKQAMDAEFHINKLYELCESQATEDTGTRG